MPLSKKRDRERKRQFQPKSNLNQNKLSNLNKILKIEGHRILGVWPKAEQPEIPLYNPAIHRAGDTVLIRRGDKLIATLIPELDGDGHQIY